MSDRRTATIDIRLHPKQVTAFLTPATELLYGGAAGGGKSHLMRAAAIIWCAEIRGLQVYLFRKTKDDLVKNHMEGPKGFRSMLAIWVFAGLVEIVEDEIRFWNGSKIYLCHCKDDKHRFKYQGAEIHVLLIDELTHFAEVVYRYLRSRVRMVGIDLPKKYKGMFPRIVCASNPGNVGHLFVKQMFIDSAPELEIHETEPSEGGMKRQFIPARLEDNPSMTEDDPSYEGKLEGLGSDALVKAIRWGDWSVIEGAYFDCWSDKLILKPFTVPKHWLKFRALDWGSAKPFSVGWWAVVSEGVECHDGWLPPGALVRYREWYGKREPDVGLKLTAEAVGQGIKERTEEKITYDVADPSIFAEDGGPSIAERIFKAAKIAFQKADNKRVAEVGHMGGWDQLRDRMIGDGRPMIYCFSTCLDSIRTIPALQHDEKRPEDLDTNMEDHAADEWRYAAMSRPWIKPKPQRKPEIITRMPTMNELHGRIDAPQPERERWI